MIYNLHTALFWFLVPIALVAINDTGAYIFGRLFGRRLIGAPFLSLSPKKTWEGFLGGGIVTVAISYALPALLRLFLDEKKWRYLTCGALDFIENADACTVPADFLDIEGLRWHVVAIAAYASIVGPFGGFYASALKRAHGVKDFGNFIPGHGGLWDRLDCQFLVAAYTAAHVGAFL